MLFISPHPGYMLTGIRQPVEHYHPTNGRVTGTSPGIDAEFRHGGAPNWAIDQALANQQFQRLWNGLPDEVDRHLYIATYDTDKQAREEGWDEETKAEVEEFLLASADYGIRYVRAVPAAETDSPPWPNYDSTHHFQVAKTAVEIGQDLNYVLEYELAHKNRPAVVKLLEEAVEENSPEPLVAA